MNRNKQPFGQVDPTGIPKDDEHDQRATVDDAGLDADIAGLGETHAMAHGGDTRVE